MSVDDTTSKLDEVAARRAEKMELSEDRLALSFCAANPMLRYVARWNRWLTWTGAVWAEDDTLHVYDKIRRHTRTFSNEANASQFTRATTVANIEKLAKADRRYAATVEQWDNDPWLLNATNGTVDLRTGKVRPSDPANHITKVTGAAIGNECPTWLLFLNQITDGDAEFVRFLQRVIGYAATGSIKEHAFFFIYGPGGNGKGTLLNTAQRVLGDYAVVSSMETFTESRGERHPTDLAMLRGARLVLAQETEEGRPWAEARIKALTGGDPVTARYMRQDFFTYEPTFKMIIAGNHKPRLKNVDEAIKRRLHLLPFMQVFRGDRCDPDLSDKLIAEADGILGWIVEGALDYQKQGLNPPQVVLDATAEYFAAENLFQQWLDECCECGPSFVDQPTPLFNSWKRFADEANEKPGSMNQFAERLEGAGFDKERNRQQRKWIGLRVKIEAQQHWQETDQ